MKLFNRDNKACDWCFKSLDGPRVPDNHGHVYCDEQCQKNEAWAYADFKARQKSNNRQLQGSDDG